MVVHAILSVWKRNCRSFYETEMLTKATYQGCVLRRYHSCNSINSEPP